ncbi:MAG: septum formation initiator family protein [Acidimicrobiia bacterium]|nr:septum formation initiator family protein [Acidimicrobiia bacterium]MDH5238808.1 septum formation initiator family protein [Acidimicrobiia bacterium]
MKRPRRRATAGERGPRRRGNRFAVLVMVGVAVLISIATVAVPARAWWQTRGEASELRSELNTLQADNADLEARRNALGTTLEIERRARAEYDLVYPDEEAYAVLPPPERDATWFHAWPF